MCDNHSQISVKSLNFEVHIPPPTRIIKASRLSTWWASSGCSPSHARLKIIASYLQDQQRRTQPAGFYLSRCCDKRTERMQVVAQALSRSTCVLACTCEPAVYLYKLAHNIATEAALRTLSSSVLCCGTSHQCICCSPCRKVHQESEHKEERRPSRDQQAKDKHRNEQQSAAANGSDG
jgi:hypothetical protein